MPHHSNDDASANPVKELLYNAKARAIGYQIAFAGLVAATFYYLATNIFDNLKKQKIASGFEFLQGEAGFDIGESLIAFSAANTYGDALLVGFLNTLKIAIIGNILALLVGAIVGVGRLSTNLLVSKVCTFYVETLRNIPLLLQLFFWYTMFTDIFPVVRQAYEPLPHLFISNRGVIYPAINWDASYTPTLIGLGITVIGVVILYLWSKKRRVEKGIEFPFLPVALAALVAVPSILWWSTGATSLTINYPVLGGFNFEGGTTLTPEFLSLLFGLVLYTGAFNAEIVRAGIMGVNKGQWEAASSLGLRPFTMFRMVIFPQAMRIIVPPTTSQILNLTKNSSLAVAIAYPDFVSIANTTMNQTGQAIEIITLIVVVYLTLSLLSSLFMNWYNKMTHWPTR